MPKFKLLLACIQIFTTLFTCRLRIIYVYTNYFLQVHTAIVNAV